MYLLLVRNLDASTFKDIDLNIQKKTSPEENLRWLLVLVKLFANHVRYVVTPIRKVITKIIVIHLT